MNLHCVRILSIVFLLTLSVAVVAEETIQNEKSEQPLYLGLPFNRLKLTSHYNGASFDVRPIEFEEGRRPTPLPQSGELTVSFLDNPLKQYTVKWIFVESVELFSELVFKEFRKRLDAFVDEVRAGRPDDESWKALAGKLEQLFDYLLFLEDFKDELPNLKAAYCKFLFEEAVYRIKSGDSATGLSRFEAVYGENKDYPGLSKAWGSALDIVLAEKTQADDYIKAKQLLSRFRTIYPDHSVVRQWEERIQLAAKGYWERSKKAFADNDFLDAHLFEEESRKVAVHPDELGDWNKELQTKAPRINVAVQEPSDTALLPDWGTVRRTRLTQRMLSEYLHPSIEGGVYETPLGTLEKSERNRFLRWKITPNLHWAGRSGTLDVFAVADALLGSEASNHGDNGRDTVWNETLQSLDMISPTELAIRLKRQYLLPEALFTVPVFPSNRFAVPADASATDVEQSFNGPFLPRPLPPDKNEPFPRRGFQINPNLVSSSSVMPKVVVEYVANRSEEAMELLLSGKVDAIDRIAPWELQKLQGNAKLITGKYAIPTICFLVPNLHKPLPSSRTFRRALLYGLNREKMLEKIVSEGVETTILSGPFLKGASLGDPLGYAYDSMIVPRPYEPKLAIALSLLAFGQIRDSEPDPDKYSEKIPELVLARPPRETAGFVALMIRRQWEAIGVPVREVEYGPDEKIGQGTEVDFWYVERTVKEPLIDAERILGRTGLLGGGSSYMELALERLRRAEDWPTASKRLQEIHRLCFEETTVLPLWQISEHFVHRTGIVGIRVEPPILNLYQNVENWDVLK